MVTSYTDVANGTHIQVPQLTLRIGRGAARQSDLSAPRSATRNRYEAEFALPTGRRGKVLHVVLSNYRAGEPWSLLALVSAVEKAGEFRVGQEAS
jgi:hypothetical protein